MWLTVQSSGKTFTSAPVALPTTRYKTVKWKAIIGEKDLTIVEDTDFTFPDFAYRRFFDTFLFSVIVELVVAAILVGWWSKKKAIPKFKLLGMVLLANIFSYPVA
jgi:hypothetical protein